MNAEHLNLDSIALAAAKAKGKRPWFFDDPAVEKVLNITMVLAAELAVCRERLDTVERLLQEEGVLTQDEIETWQADEEAEQARNLRQRDYIARVMRIVVQQSEADAEPVDIEAISKKLSEEK